MSSSSSAIRACVKYCTRNISFENLHAMYHRATPEKILLYKSAISLYKLYNYEDLSIEWVSLNVNQILTSRQTKFVISKAHIKKLESMHLLTDCTFWITRYPLTGSISLMWHLNCIVKRNFCCFNDRKLCNKMMLCSS